MKCFVSSRDLLTVCNPPHIHIQLIQVIIYHPPNHSQPKHYDLWSCANAQINLPLNPNFSNSLMCQFRPYTKNVFVYINRMWFSILHGIWDGRKKNRFLPLSNEKLECCSTQIKYYYLINDAEGIENGKIKENQIIISVSMWTHTFAIPIRLFIDK